MVWQSPKTNPYHGLKKKGTYVVEIVVTPLHGEYRKLSFYTAEIFQPDFTIMIPF